MQLLRISRNSHASARRAAPNWPSAWPELLQATTGERLTETEATRLSRRLYLSDAH